MITIDGVARAFGVPTGEAAGNSISVPGKGHSAKDRSLRVTIDPSAPDGFLVHNHSSRDGMDDVAAKDYVRQVVGAEPWKPNGKGGGAKTDWPNLGKKGGPAKYVYVYRHADGEEAFVVARWEPQGQDKIIRHLTRVRGGWEWKILMKGPRPLYRLRQLIENPTQQVWVVEGEKKADALAAVMTGFAVITWSCGATGAKPTDWSPIKDRDVIFWPDNDDPGVAGLNLVSDLMLKAGARRVRFVPPGDKPAKWDAWDAINKDGWDKAAVIEWAKGRMLAWSTETAPRIARSDVVPIRPDMPISKAAPPAGHVMAPEYSDEALALFFADRFEDALRYVYLWGKWMIWAGGRWIEDDTLDGLDRIRLICRQMAQAYALTAKSPSGPKAIASAKTANAVMSLARADRRLAATVDQWDANNWLLNTPSVTIDLRTTEARPHRPGDYMTHIATVDPAGDCPIWLGFLDRVCGSDRSLVDYLQRVYGYCLTGDTSEHAMFFMYGTGANGKSVFINTVSGILGDHHKTAPIETFTLASGDRHPTELARLRGARMVTSVETEDGRRWAESRIKSLTGGDTVTARFMRQDFFEYQPRFKLIVAGNHKPGLRSVDEAIRRRLKLIPFAVTIPPDERDPELGEKLKAEWPGILQWMIDGCVEWQSRGLAAPEIVTSATDAYLAAEDAIGAWIEERCETGPNLWGGSSDLFASWDGWAEKNGEHRGSKKRFVGALETRGFQHAHTRTGNGFYGIKIKPDEGYGGMQ